jgi:formylglycine-generating enzyme required for sulfatase activity/uncharacterized caspase-like protein
MKPARGIALLGTLICAFLLSGFASAAHADRRVALVVGNSAYSSAAALRNPSNDARDMAEALKKLGFEVVLGIDLDQDRFATTIETFARTLDSADVALFFYAGHGLQINDKNYLVSINAELTNEFLITSETIQLDAIIRLMESKTPINIVLLDACRNNPLTENLKRSLEVMRRTATLGRGLARVEPSGRDTLVAFAAAPGQEAADGMGRNSPFTAALLQHMPKPGVEISVMLKEVAADVREATRGVQRPQQISDMSRQFYFARPSVVTTKTEPAAKAAPSAPSPSRTAQGVEDRTLEIAFWNSARASNECDAIRAYLQKYPKGFFVDLAKLSEARLCVSERTVTMVETVPQANPPPPSASAPPAPLPSAPKAAASVKAPPSAEAKAASGPPAIEHKPATPSTATKTAAAPPPSSPAPGLASPPKSTPPAPPPVTPTPAPVAAAAPPAPVEAPKPAPPAEQKVAVVKPPATPLAPAPMSANSFRDCERCPEMVNVPGGSFHMGSNDDPSEKPVHEVTIAAFAIGRYPVTIGEWRQCVADKACSYEPTGDDNLPVYNVSWSDAQQYVAWLSKTTKQHYRLPSEAEWEYAARAKTTTRYWWGDQPPNGKAACKGCGTDADASQPIKVGNFPPNGLGLNDMTGSVSQWVADCWVKDYQGAPRNGAARELPNCRQYVLRGGSWKNDARYLRSGSRDYYDKGVRYLAHGFRVARQKGN